VDAAADPRLSYAADKAAAMLYAGRHLGDALRALRSRGLDAGEVTGALRAIAPISVDVARTIVAREQAGESLAHLGAEHLVHLGRIPRETPIGGWLRAHLEHAILDGGPWRLYVRDRPGAVRYYNGRTADPTVAGSMCWRGLSLDTLRADANAARFLPGWADEIRVERDEPDELLIHFPRVRAL
jgi:hypothetical protein